MGLTLRRRPNWRNLLDYRSIADIPNTDLSVFSTHSDIHLRLGAKNRNKLTMRRVY